MILILRNDRKVTIIVAYKPILLTVEFISILPDRNILYIYELQNIPVFYVKYLLI